MDITDPRIRIRISHSKTIKEGWGYETTVEFDSTPTPDLMDTLKLWLEAARAMGETERDIRNHRESNRTVG